MKKNSLGRGLESLIPKNETKASVGEIDMALIYANTNQPRKRFDQDTMDELVSSVREKGVIQPIVLTKTDEGYMIIAGERRFRAAGLAGLKKIPAIVKNVDNEAERLELALIENVQRQDLNSYDLSMAYKNLMENYGYTQEEVAKVIGKSRSAVANTLRLLNLPPKAMEALKEELITEGHARALLSLEDEKKVIPLLKKVIEGCLSVRETERLAAKYKKDDKTEKTPKSPEADVFLMSLKNELEEFFKTRITLKAGKKGGTIEIKYGSDDELDRIIKTIRGEE
jgi:ParB family chromosome partitioning protein